MKNIFTSLFLVLAIGFASAQKLPPKPPRPGHPDKPFFLKKKKLNKPTRHNRKKPSIIAPNGRKVGPGDRATVKSRHGRKIGPGDRPSPKRHALPPRPARHR